MENYKINVFDDKKLIKNYIENNINNLTFHNIEELIFNIYNSKESNLNIIFKLYEKEILEIAKNNDYITSDGFLYSSEDLNLFKDAYNEIENEDGSITIINCPIDYRKLEKRTSSINDLIYLSDEDNNIYLNIQAEKLYKELINLGLEITGFSGSLEPVKQIDLANGVTKIFIFNIKVADKKAFINNAIKILEGKVKVKGYTIKKLKEELIDNIKLLDEKYGTNGKNILVTNKKKTNYFNYVLLLLCLENKINIIDYKSYKNEFEIDLISQENIKIQNENEMKDDYYKNIKKEEVFEKQEKTLIYKDIRLFSKDGKLDEKVSGYQKTLCENIFEEGYLKDKSFHFHTLEEMIYGKEQKSIEKIKSLIKEIKKKLTKLGYKNIIEYGDETLITRKN